MQSYYIGPRFFLKIILRPSVNADANGDIMAAIGVFNFFLICVHFASEKYYINYGEMPFSRYLTSERTIQRLVA